MIYSVGNNIVIDSLNKKSQISLRGHDNRVTSIAANRSGLIASGQMSSPGNKNYDSPVFLWSFTSGKILGVLEGLKEGVKNVVFSDDGHFVGGVSAKEQLMIWNTKTLQQTYVKIFENPVNILNFKGNFMTILNSKMIQ